MARVRSIKPGFFENEDLSACSPLARLLFAGLWCWADREGRLVDRPRVLKNQILGFDDCDVDALLEELAAAGFILRYEVQEKRYIAVLHFTEHQRPHPHEARSVIPPPNSAPSKAKSTPSSDIVMTSSDIGTRCLPGTGTGTGTYNDSGLAGPTTAVDSPSKRAREEPAASVIASLELVGEPAALVGKAVEAYPNVLHDLELESWKNQNPGWRRLAPPERARRFAKWLAKAEAFRQQDEARASPNGHSPPPALSTLPDDPEEDARVQQWYDDLKAKKTHERSRG